MNRSAECIYEESLREALWAFSAQHSESILYQISLMSALLSGIYEGSTTIADLLRHGDFSLGTFNELDGELTAFSSQVYQLRVDGSTCKAQPEQETSFAMMTWFQPQYRKALDHPVSRQQLYDVIDQQIPSDNLFYALRTDGYFRYAHTHIMPRQTSSYRAITDTLDSQLVLRFNQREGVLVGFRTPQHVQGISVAGYREHFITDDREGGGHLLDYQLDHGVLTFGETHKPMIDLSVDDAFPQVGLHPGNLDATIRPVESQGIHMDKQYPVRQWAYSANLVVSQPEAWGVRQIFGTPGARIDKMFDSLLSSSICIIPIRHKTNTAFTVVAVRHITGKAGVALVISGPGCSNLITGVAIANSGGDPAMALGSAVKRADKARQVHQNMGAVAMSGLVTEHAVEVTAPDVLVEVVSNTLRAAEQSRLGSAFISLPQDVVDGPVSGKVLPVSRVPQMGATPNNAADQVAKPIARAKNPAFLPGLMASQPESNAALRHLLGTSHIPATSTYQAVEAVNRDSLSRFAGRVGPFNNQVGDRLLQLADLVTYISCSPVEYESTMWNSGNATLVHIDVLPAYGERNHTPDVELVGDIVSTLNKLVQNIDHRLMLSPQTAEILHGHQHQRELLDRRGAQLNQFVLRPLRIVRTIQDIVSSDITLTVDMSSFHIWIARYPYSFRTHQVMISNGQQTVGVVLPWAISAWLASPERKVVSVSGGGGFLQLSMELETAARLKASVLHLIWVDNGYNMVVIQEEKKCQHLSGVEFGPMDFRAYIESFGAGGFTVESAKALEPTLRAAMDVDGPAMVATPVNHRDSPLLMGQLHLSQIL